jgi:prefoldin alpha subunit
MEKSQQELMAKLSMFEQQTQHLNQQLQAVSDGIIEMSSLNFALDELKGKTGKEVLSPLGRGIFTKTKLISEDLIVDIGGKNFVKKSIPEAKEIIEDQMKKLEDVKKSLEAEIEKVNEELMDMFMAAQAENSEKKG